MCLKGDAVIMVKKLLACMLLVMLAAGCAFAGVRLEPEHYSLATLKDGKADYSDARFSHMLLAVKDTGLTVTAENMNLTGNLTISGGRYSFWNGTELEKVSGTQKTFGLRLPTSAGLGDNAEFYPFTDAGGNLRLGVEADSGLNGVTMSWNFPTMTSLNGSCTLPSFLTTAQQLENYVVYFEFIRSGENVTGINWRVVKASDTSTALTLSYPVNFIRLRIWNFDEERIVNLRPDFYMEAGQTLEGTLTFDSPIKESDIWRVRTKFYTYDDEAAGEIGKCHYWDYCKATEPKLYLWNHHASNASLVNGKSDYSTAKFSDIFFDVETENTVQVENRHFTSEGQIVVPGGGYTLKYSDTGAVISDVAAGTDRTFPLKIYRGANIGDTYLEYEAADSNGEYLEFAEGAEASLPGKTLTWTFPTELNMNGSGVIKNFKTTTQQLASGVPYVEIVSKDGYITALNYKIVTSSDTSTAITPSYRTDFNFRIYRTDRKLDPANSYNVGTASDSTSGTYTLETPQPLSTMKRLRVRLTTYETPDNPTVYQWNFYPASAEPEPEPEPTPTPEPEPTPNNIDNGRGGCESFAGIIGLFILGAFLLAEKSILR